jgi:hypothetical protein
MDQDLLSDRSEDAILNCDAPDDALERLALTGAAITNNPTAPYAIICVPFERS